MPSPDDRATRAIYWRQHITHWKNSSLSQIAYCREHALNFHRFNYWLRKDTPLKPKKEPAQQSAAFVPIIKHQAVPAGLSLNFPNGIILQGIDATNLETVKHLTNILS